MEAAGEGMKVKPIPWADGTPSGSVELVYEGPEDLPLMLTMGCTLLNMTLEHAWAGVTTEAADAVARPDLGRLVPGAQADAVISKNTVLKLNLMTYLDYSVIL